MRIVISGVKPYDGAWTLDSDDELTTREFGWIKRLSGYLPLELDKALEGGDAEFMCVLAAIALRRAGTIEAAEVPDVFERLADAPGSGITFEANQADEDDAGPPEPSSNGSASTSGIASPTSSETSVRAIRTVSGTPASASSPSVRPTSGS